MFRRDLNFVYFVTGDFYGGVLISRKVEMAMVDFDLVLFMVHLKRFQCVRYLYT